MTSTKDLRLLQTLGQALQVTKFAQSIHVGQLSGLRRLHQDGAGMEEHEVATQTEQESTKAFGEERPRISEFTKTRTRAFTEAVDNGLYKDTYPRLVHRQKPLSVPAFRKIWSGAKLDHPGNTEVVTLYGRVQSTRLLGNKLMFVTIVNEFEKIQGMINYRNLGNVSGINIDTFKLFARLIERGDHISITGKPTRTNTGELTVQAYLFPELLSPTMEQIPRKLTDPETKVRKRHVDMIVNSEVADTLRLRSYITKYMRDYFHENHFLEFQTPILAENAGGAIARSFTTQATEFPSKEISLRVAPELWLKRLVIGGVHKVFEIGPAFRNEGIDGTHNPEFTMCEFYNAYANLSDLIARTEELLAGLAAHCQQLIESHLTSLEHIDVPKFARPFRQVQFVPALEEALGFCLPKLTGKNAYSELIALLTLANVEIPGETPPTMPKLLERLATLYLEPKSFDGPLFITHHPACMSPLAKSFVCPDSVQLVSARSELFVNGRELANMYEEENDPSQQARKLAMHRCLGTSKDPAPLEKMGVQKREKDAPRPRGDELQPWRKQLQPRIDELRLRRDAPLDKSYLQALEAGLPPTGGWGCGVERLVMLFSGAKRISDCLSFGTLNNVVGLTSGAQNDPESF